MMADIRKTFGRVEFLATVDDRNVASERLLARLRFIDVDASDPKNVLWHCWVLEKA